RLCLVRPLGGICPRPRPDTGPAWGDVAGAMLHRCLVRMPDLVAYIGKHPGSSSSTAAAVADRTPRRIAEDHLTLTRRRGFLWAHAHHPGPAEGQEAPRVADRAAAPPRRSARSRHPALPRRGPDARTAALGRRISTLRAARPGLLNPDPQAAQPGLP